MNIEVLGFFIILGILVIVVMRQRLWPDMDKGRGEDLEEASARMKRELERSADEIIQRLNERIERLETLLAQTERHSRQLEAQIAFLQDPSRQASFHKEQQPFVQQDNGFGVLLEASMQQKTIPGGYDDALQAEMFSHEEDVATEEEIPTVSEWEMLSRETAEVVVAPSVADVVDLPMTPEEEAWNEAEYADESPDKGYDAVASRQLQERDASQKARDLLQAGKSVDEIAHELNLGSGAVALLRQMELNAMRQL